MKRTTQLLPLPPIQMKSGSHQTPFRSAAPTGRDWYRIENKKDSGPAKIYIYDEIGFWGTSAQDFIKALAEVENSAIDVHLNSPGGELFDGIAIYNALRMHDAEVTVYIDALAASAASFIAQAGDKIVMARNATMMIHDGIGIVFGNAEDMRDTARLLDKQSNNIADIYAQRAGGTIDEWRGMMKAETWYTGQEAVDAHLADELTDTVVEENPAENKWDLSFFNYAGRDAAPSPQKVREQITNRATEALVGKTTNSAEGQPATPAATPEVPEEEEVTAPEGTAVVEPAVAPVVPAVAANLGGTHSFGTTGTSTGTVGGPSQITFKINGQDVTDVAQVQSYIDGLETFRSETRDQARKGFVAALAAEPNPKILASQIPDLEKFVDTLTDEQYEMWMTSWGAVTSPSLLQTPAVNPASTTPAGKVVNKDEEIEKYEGIVRQHKLSGMPKAAIEKTDSYNRLLQLVPDFKL